MAQYYSPFFQSGLLQADKTPTPSRTVTPQAGPSRNAAVHRPSASVATASSASAAAESAAHSLYFVFGKTGSLRAPGTRPPTQSTGAGEQPRHPAHASFLSMDTSEHGHRSVFSSAPPLAIPRRKTGVPQPDSPPSPALSTQSTQSHLLRPLPSPVPSTRSLKPTSSLDAANGPTRALSNGSSLYRRTNRSRALAALEGRAESQRNSLKPGLRSVPESRSFVPFDSEGEEDDEEDQPEDTRFRRFVETTRAAALREKQERERARREAEEHERRGFASYAPPATAATPAVQFPEPPSSAPAHAYNYNFIDLDDDISSSSTRTRSDLSRSFASMSVGSPPLPPARVPLPAPSPAPLMLPPLPPSPAPLRMLHTPVPVRTASQQHTGWQNSAMHIASAA